MCNLLFLCPSANQTNTPCFVFGKGRLTLSRCALTQTRRLREITQHPSVCWLKKRVQAVYGAVVQRNACHHGCGAQAVHLNSQNQRCRKCRSAVSIWGCVSMCCVISCEVCALSQQAYLPCVLLIFILQRVLGGAGAKWEYRGPGEADQPANTTCCRPNKRKYWYESNSADLGSGAWKWWDPNWRTRACAIVLLYPQRGHGKDPPGCTTWIQPK